MLQRQYGDRRRPIVRHERSALPLPPEDAGSGGSAPYSLLSRTVLRLSEEAADRICGEAGLSPDLGDLPHELIEELLRGLFILPDAFDEFAFVKAQHLQARADRRHESDRHPDARLQHELLLLF